jgi:hypothetical protein
VLVSITCVGEYNLQMSITYVLVSITYVLVSITYVLVSITYVLVSITYALVSITYVLLLTFCNIVDDNDFCHRRKVPCSIE